MNRNPLNTESLFSVAGKVALVTGGTRGIGEMITAGFLANGVRVYISSRSAEACEKTAARLSENYGGECIGVPADVSHLDGVSGLADFISSREKRLHILVNNAGVSWRSPVDEFTEEGWDRVMNTNVKGAFFLTQKLLPLLRSAATADDPARVVNIGSVDGIKNPRWENFSYGPSKAAVHHMTRQLASHLVKENIIMNAIAPGPFPTEMLARGIGQAVPAKDVSWDRTAGNNPRGRVGTAEDIAGLAIFLCSRAGAFTVGATITCDGGAVARS